MGRRVKRRRLIYERRAIWFFTFVFLVAQYVLFIFVILNVSFLFLFFFFLCLFFFLYFMCNFFLGFPLYPLVFIVEIEKPKRSKNLWDTLPKFNNYRYWPHRQNINQLLKNFDWRWWMEPRNTIQNKTKQKKGL